MSFDSVIHPSVAFPPEDPWYLAFTKPRMESTALLHLERQGFHTYLPLYKTHRVSPEGWRASFEPMFPRYLFISAPATQSLSKVRSTRGVQSLVTFGGTIAQVPPAVLQQVQAVVRLREQADPDGAGPLQAGDRVRLRKGSLQAIEGLVVSVARQRVSFLINLLGRDSRVTVDAAELVLA